MGDVAKLFGAPRDLLFVESILLKEWFDARDESVDVQNLRPEIDIISSPRRSLSKAGLQPSSRLE